MAKLAVFLDGGYVDALARYQFAGVRVDYQRLGEEIHRRVADDTADPVDLLRAYYYDCPPYQSSTPTEQERERYRRKRNFLHSLSRLPRFQVREGRLQYQGNDSFGRPIFQQKRVDLLLGLDIALLSAKQQIGHVALLAGDSDFIPAVAAAKREGVSVWLFHGPWRGADGNPTFSSDLWEEADERYEIDTVFMEAVRRGEDLA